MEGGRPKSSDKRRERFVEALAAGAASLKAGRVVGRNEMKRRIDKAFATRAAQKAKAHTS